MTGGTLSEFDGASASYTAVFTPRIGPTSNAGIATIFVAEGAFSDSFGNRNLASNELELDFGDALVERTSRIVNNFMVRRMDQMVSNQPDISGRLNRNGGNASQAGSFTGEGNFNTNNRFGFSTSLRDIAAYQQRDQRAPSALDGDELGRFGARPMAQTHGSVPADVWIAGSVARIENETSKSTLGLLFGGLDYAVTPELVLGVMGQLDWVEEDDDTRESSASGMGWMVGPYFVAEVDESLILDGRFAWGQSDNTVSPFNTYEDDFDTNRWLVSSKLTGSASYKDVQLRPQVGLIYFEETQLAYTDSNGLFIPEQDVALGRFTFSPNFTHSHTTADEATLTTNWTVTGIWDFETADLVNLDSGLIASRDANIRARTELGFSFQMPNGMSLGADGFYDGIGVNEYRAYGGTIRLSIPLQ